MKKGNIINIWIIYIFLIMILLGEFFSLLFILDENGFVIKVKLEFYNVCVFCDSIIIIFNGDCLFMIGNSDVFFIFVKYI